MITKHQYRKLMSEHQATLRGTRWVEGAPENCSVGPLTVHFVALWRAAGGFADATCPACAASIGWFRVSMLATKVPEEANSRPALIRLNPDQSVFDRKNNHISRR